MAPASGVTGVDLCSGWLDAGVVCKVPCVCGRESPTPVWTLRGIWRAQHNLIQNGIRHRHHQFQQVPPVAPATPVAPPSPAPAPPAPPAPRWPASTLGVAPCCTIRSPSTSGALRRVTSTPGSGSVPTLKLGTPVSGVRASRPWTAPSGRLEIPVPTLRLSHSQVPDWYLPQGGPSCDRYDVGMIESQLDQLPLQVKSA